MNSRVRRALKIALGAVVVVAVLFAVVQAIPYGRTHSNPPIIEEPAWDSPRTRELAVRACFDCHSNETKWPWYANLAPFSWAVQFDVEAGRSVVNFSEWHRSYALAGYSAQRTTDGNMPPYKYMMAHPEANLTAQERMELARGLEATINTATSQRD
jgi:hypothetical protein